MTFIEEEQFRGSVHAGDDLDKRYKVRVLLDGKDVTAECQSATSGDPGSVCLNLRASDGSFYLAPPDMKELARVTRKGRVEIFLRERSK